MASHGLPRISKEKDAEKELQRIKEYQQLLSQLDGHIAFKNVEKPVLDLTAKILAKNPEYYTVWNHRRRVLVQQLTEGDADSLLVADLDYLVPLLMQFPKCYWIWNYRLWLLNQAEEFLSSERTEQLWAKELALVGKMLSRDERNFHGWDYRRNVVIQLERLRALDEIPSSMVEAEFEYTSKMIRRALHNFSALHYRSKLIPRLLDERRADASQRRAMMEQELDLMQEALIDPYNQSSWFYHQFLMSTLAPDHPPNASILLDISEDVLVHYYQREIERIEEMLEDFDDCKWIYQALIQYSLELAKYSNYTQPSSSMNHWLSELRRLDPMRSGRWQHLESCLQL